MLREKRATRGTRMTALVGEAAEDDEAFWGHGIWQENESDNESYETEEEKPDVFDSDFNDSEDDGDDEEESGSDDEAPAKVSCPSRHPFVAIFSFPPLPLLLPLSS